MFGIQTGVIMVESKSLLFTASERTAAFHFDFWLSRCFAKPFSLMNLCFFNILSCITEAYPTCSLCVCESVAKDLWNRHLSAQHNANGGGWWSAFENWCDTQIIQIYRAQCCHQETGWCYKTATVGYLFFNSGRFLLTLLLWKHETEKRWSGR